MKFKLLIFFLFIGKLAFTQLPTYKAKYSCIKSMSLPASSDTISINTDELSMEAEIEVIANNKYALVTTTILKMSSPVFQNEIEQLILKDNVEVQLAEYDTKTVYSIKDIKAFTYIADVFDTSAYTEKIGKHTCNLYYEHNNNQIRDVYNIWATKTIPWYINPGLFYSEDIGGIVKLDNTETVIELKEFNKTKFDFTSLLKKMVTIKKTDLNQGRLQNL
jgi:hypothetical protein